MTPRRIQLSRKKGWRLPPNTIIVARPSKWGNPHKVCADVSAELAVHRFREDIEHHPEYLGIEKLRGKNLACWCKLCKAHADGLPLGVECADCQPCHANTLLVLSNAAAQLPHGVYRADDPNEEADHGAGSSARGLTSPVAPTASPEAREVAPSVSDDRAGTSITAAAAPAFCSEPLRPADLVDALQDKIHQDMGQSRPVQAVRVIPAAPTQSGPNTNVICHAPGDKRLGCAHYYGKASYCEYKPVAVMDAAPTPSKLPEEPVEGLGLRSRLSYIGKLQTYAIEQTARVKELENECNRLTKGTWSTEIAKAQQRTKKAEAERNAALAAAAMVRDECTKACELERVSSDETDGRLGEEDEAYNRAIDHCVDAIRVLPLSDLEAGREIVKDAKRLKHLHDNPKRAQAYFWNHQGRKERNAAIDVAISAQKETK